MQPKEQQWRDLFGSEYERIIRYGKAITDPDDKRVFWDSILEAKRADPHWSFDSISPSKRTATERARDACIDSVKRLRRPVVPDGS